MLYKYVPMSAVGRIVNWVKDGFVQKDGSKVLSDRNYTKEDKEKLDSIENNAVSVRIVHSLDDTTSDGIWVVKGGRSG